MLKVRDYDAELKALGNKARVLKAKKIQQLGELMIATGADVLDPDILAGAFLAPVKASTQHNKEWRTKGVTFFQGRRRKVERGATDDSQNGSEADAGRTQD